MGGPLCILRHAVPVCVLRRVVSCHASTGSFAEGRARIEGGLKSLCALLRASSKFSSCNSNPHCSACSTDGDLQVLSAGTDWASAKMKSLGSRSELQMPTSAGKPSADRCQDLSICLKAAFSFAFCGSLLLCSEHHFCAPFSKIRAATTDSLHCQQLLLKGSPCLKLPETSSAAR